MQYELVTIKDIFEKVPADKIQICMAEIATGLSQAAAMRDLFKHVAEHVSEQEGIDGTAIVKCPDVFTWVDDGKGEVDVTFTANGEQVMKTQTIVDSGT